MCKCDNCTAVYVCKNGKEICTHGLWDQEEDYFISSIEGLKEYKAQERLCSDFEHKA